MQLYYVNKPSKRTIIQATLRKQNKVAYNKRRWQHCRACMKTTRALSARDVARVSVEMRTLPVNIISIDIQYLRYYCCCFF